MSKVDYCLLTRTHNHCFLNYTYFTSIRPDHVIIQRDGKKDMRAKEAFWMIVEMVWQGSGALKYLLLGIQEQNIYVNRTIDAGNIT